MSLISGGGGGGGGAFNGGTITTGLTIAPAAASNELVLEVPVGQAQDILRVLVGAGTFDAFTVSPPASGLILSVGGAHDAGDVPVTILANTGQTASLLDVQDNSAVTLSRFDKDGYFMTRKVAAPADAALSNSEVALWLDATPAATKLMVKAKDSGGTVRTAAVALA